MMTKTPPRNLIYEVADMSDKPVGPISAYGFCNDHKDMAKSWLQAEIILGEVRDNLKEVCLKFGDHIALEGHPLMVERMAALVRWQERQTEISGETANTLRVIQQTLATNTDERRIVMDRSTRISVAWIAAVMTVISGAIAGGAAVYAAHQAAVQAVTAAVAR
jgi:hypothetical protein